MPKYRYEYGIPVLDNSEAYNDFIGDIAERAGYLAIQKMDDLRSMQGTADTLHGLREECLGLSKSDLIVAILMDEFCCEL